MFKEERDEFKFEWSHLGDIKLGRPNLGPKTSVAVYRLMQFTLRDAAIKHTDAETTRNIFYDAGHTAGEAVYENLIESPADFSDLIAKLQKLLMDLEIGVLRVEDADVDNLTFRLTVSEDLDCSGLPLMDEAVCTYDEGFIAGILEAHTGTAFRVQEVDCWCTGDRVCRFEAIPRAQGSERPARVAVGAGRTTR
jgi:predicted hydrocarbon binding protein